MNSRKKSLCVSLLVVILSSLMAGQQPSASSPVVVPRLMNFSGRAVDARGEVVADAKSGRTIGATFAIYKEQYEGAPLWIETQSITTDSRGNYSVQLGASRSEGVPLELFASGEARWLGVRINGGEEQPRVLLLSVPYALKAADAQTLGGLPASAFVLAAPLNAERPVADSTAVASATNPAAVSGTGTADYLPLWTNSTGALGNSVLFQSGTGATTRIGINTTTPAATLDVKGAATVRGTLSLASTGPATAAAGKNSQPLSLTASVFNSSIGAAVNQTFRLQSEAAGNDTANAGGSLSFLYGSGANPPTETGLKIASNGKISFASGQTFPGTTTSIGLSAPSSDFTVSGSPVSGTGTLALNWAVAPTYSNTGNAIVKRDPNGNFSAGAIVASSATANAVLGSYSGTSTGAGVYGSSTDEGVYGTGGYYGVVGVTSKGIDGVYGSGPIGVYGGSSSGSGYGVYGYSQAGTGTFGYTSTGYGVYGAASSTTAGTGVYGIGVTGVIAVSNEGSSGLYATSNGGWAVNANGTDGATGVLAASDYGYAGFFDGDVHVDGNLSKSAGSFKIDHPLDPANKYLYHSFVESPDMMNIYNGNVTTSAQGDAVVTLPNWFETLNRDFRYQLTVMGQFAQAIISAEVVNHQFAIKTDKPNVKVSWQVTGIRQDAWANAHRIPVEETKPENERGFYQHPELYGAPKEKSIMWARFPKAMKQWKETPTKPAIAATAPPLQPNQ